MKRVRRNGSTQDDLDTLKSWCHWKRKEQGVSEDDIEFVQAIEAVISQVGTWKAKYERQAGKEREVYERGFKDAVELHREVKKTCTCGHLGTLGRCLSHPVTTHQACQACQGTKWINKLSGGNERCPSCVTERELK